MDLTRDTPDLAVAHVSQQQCRTFLPGAWYQGQCVRYCNHDETFYFLGTPGVVEGKCIQDLDSEIGKFPGKFPNEGLCIDHVV